jgi:hypothetical protein
MRAQMAYDKANLDFADAIGGPLQEPELLALAGKVGRLQDQERAAREAAHAERQLSARGGRKTLPIWPTSLI